MSDFPRQIRTMAKLMFRGRFALLRDRGLIAARRFRLRRQGSQPFIYRREGHREVCHPDWHLSREHYCHVGREDSIEFMLLRHWLQPGDVFLDLGANRGAFSFAALRSVGRHGRVVAVDADPFACGKLQAAFALLGADSSRCVHAALMDRAGEVTFHISTDGVRSDIQSLRPDATAQTKGMRAVTVPALTLSGLSDAELRGVTPDMVKLDIEGAEQMALSACPAAWLGPNGPMWIVELNPSCLAEFGATPADVADFFAGGFDRWLVPKYPRPGAAGIRRLSGDEGFSDALFYNMVALPCAAGERWPAQNIRRMLGT
jgi:FkbM family methyltransferase